MNAATTTPRRTRRQSDKSAEQAIANGAHIPETGGKGNGIPNNEKKHDERFIGISTATLVTAIENAAGFSKSALHLELAVGLLLFANHGKADLAAKKDLAIVYQQAGYKCATPNDEDYKTVNRRINVAAEFFNWLDGAPTVKEWIMATTEMQSIQAIVRHLEDEFNFKGMNSVMAHIGKPVILKRERERKAAQVKGAKPEAKIEQQPPQAARAGEKGVAAAIASKSAEQAMATTQPKQEAEANVYVIQTAHIRVEIPLDVPKDELIQLSMQLLEIANTLQVAEA